MTRYISASEIGKAAFCPMAAYYDENKIPTMSKHGIRRANEGTASHSKLNDQVKGVQRSQSLVMRFIKWLFSVLFKR